ncbi:MAG: SLBB domain-containing protein [Muribaculaceae bacterium]|nr:SLBB domain-containing protein [Muribaculaceae bacterium]
MKIKRLILPLMLLMALPGMAMTDSQVIEYITTQSAAGKSQDQIGKELIARGVPIDQIKRLKAQYEKGDLDDQTGSTKTSKSSTSRTRNNAQDTKTSKKNATTTPQKTSTQKLREKNMRLKKDVLDFYTKQSANTSSSLGFGIDDDSDATGSTKSSSYLDIRNTPLYDPDYEFQPDEIEKIIYGHDIFETQELTFEPNANMATPKNYRLGPGDEVIIDIWGASEDNIRQEISPDGSIIISQLGPVHLNGMTVTEANNHIRNIFARKYAGVGTETDISLTLGNIRSIQVDVMGEVQLPGTFRLSPFSNVFHALYNAGGINEIGSMRNIEVLRNGKRIATVDFYDYLFKGRDTGNVRLQEGDVIIVPPYAELISAEGNVKRPMFYELKQDESLAKLLEYAGGFAGNAYSDVVRIERLNGSEKQILTIDKTQFPSYMLQDGDVVSIGSVTNKYSNKVELKGAVNRPGTYAIGNGITTVKELLQKADGLAEDAYMDRAIIMREKPDRSLEVVSFNVSDLMSGIIADIPLNKNDVIEIGNVNTLTERGDVQIQGYIKNYGLYPYAEGMTIEDLILQAGGLLEGASTARVEVARRIVDPTDTLGTNQLSKVFTFNISEGQNDSRNFTLKPYDIVNIRKSPSYNKQEQMLVEGNVLFPGHYILQSRNERVSEIIKRAGGVLESAYVKGAYLVRQSTPEQKEMRNQILRLARSNANSKDTISIDSLLLTDRDRVGIDLVKALENPGSTYDFVVQEGDILTIPEMQSTVNIMGEVLYPNSVVYVPGKKLKYYIDQAGGYGERARKSKAFVIYMNGSVAKAKGNTTIEPGCQIVIPTKPDGKPFDWSKVFSITSTLGSLASVAATIYAITK